MRRIRCWGIAIRARLFGQTKRAALAVLWFCDAGCSGRLFGLIRSRAGADGNEAGRENHEHEDGGGEKAVHLISPVTFIFSTQLESRCC
jgi:hypothetical protein